MGNKFRRKEVAATVLDIREVCAGRRVLLCSDPHGCYDELMEALERAYYIPGVDVLIIAGDLNDRGPKIKQIFEFVMETPLVFCVRGNHDWKLQRFLLDRPVQPKSLEATIKQLELVHPIEEVAEANRERYLEFLDNLPHLIRFGDQDWAVHAGVHPHMEIAENSSQFCMYGGRFNPATNEYGRDTGHVWYQFYERPDRIFFGHLVHSEPFPEHAPKRNVIALDGGCVFGGVMRVCILENGHMSIVEAPAKKVYFGRYLEGQN